MNFFFAGLIVCTEHVTTQFLGMTGA